MNPLIRLHQWAVAHGKELRNALRTTVSAGLAYAIADALHLAQPTWAVISAIIVARASRGGAVKSGRDRIIGTLVGAVVGVLLALGRPTGMPELALIVIGVAVLALAAALNRSFLAAPIALVIVLSSDPSGQSSTVTALHRMTEVGLGAAIAILVALVPLSARRRGAAPASVPAAAAPATTTPPRMPEQPNREP
jgi:uncharacterized membrane protein YccC